MVRPRLLVVATAATMLLAGCFTGERPSFAPVQAEVADPAIAAVLERLEGRTDDQFTAAYTILTKLTSGSTPTSADIAAPDATPTATSNVTSASVARTSATALSVTIGNIRFLEQDGGRQTCDLTAASCQSDLVDASVSNVLVTHDFYSASPAARLRQDAATMVSAGVASTREVAGQTATCVQVSFAAGIKVYCALDNGLLAFQDTPDVQVDLVSLTAGADPALFTTSTVAG